MSEDDRAYLVQMLEMLERLSASIEGLSRDAFLIDADKFDAACMRLLVLGEAAGRLSSEAKFAATAVPWPMIRGLRNRLAHGYFEINPDLLWQVLTEDAPRMRTELLAVLRRLGP